MRADHDHVARIAAARFGQQVVGLGLLAHHVDVHAQLQPRGLRPGHAVIVGREHHRDAAAVVLAQGCDQQPLAVLGVPLVEDDGASRTGRRGIARFLPEWTGAALHQGDGTGREAGEVLGLTAAGGGVASAESQVDRHHRCGDIARIGLIGVGKILLPDVLGRLRRHGAQRAGADGIEGEEREGLHFDAITGALQAAAHVVDRRLITGLTGRTIAVVHRGDVLQRLQVLHDVARLHAARQTDRSADQQGRTTQRRVGLVRRPEVVELRGVYLRRRKRDTAGK